MVNDISEMGKLTGIKAKGVFFAVQELGDFLDPTELSRVSVMLNHVVGQRRDENNAVVADFEFVFNERLHIKLIEPSGEDSVAKAGIALSRDQDGLRISVEEY